MPNVDQPIGYSLAYRRSCAECGCSTTVFISSEFVSEMDALGKSTKPLFSRVSVDALTSHVHGFGQLFVYYVPTTANPGEIDIRIFRT